MGFWESVRGLLGDWKTWALSCLVPALLAVLKELLRDRAAGIANQEIDTAFREGGGSVLSFLQEPSFWVVLLTVYLSTVLLFSHVRAAWSVWGPQASRAAVRPVSRSAILGRENLDLTWKDPEWPYNELRIVALNKTLMPLKHCTIWILDIAKWSDQHSTFIGQTLNGVINFVSDVTVQCEEMNRDSYRLIKASSRDFRIEKLGQHAKQIDAGVWKIRIKAEFDIPEFGRDGIEIKRKYNDTSVYFSWNPTRTPLLRTEQDPRRSV